MSKLSDCLKLSNLSRSIKGALKSQARKLGSEKALGDLDAAKEAVEKFHAAAVISRDAIAAALAKKVEPQPSKKEIKGEQKGAVTQGTAQKEAARQGDTGLAEPGTGESSGLPSKRRTTEQAAIATADDARASVEKAKQTHAKEIEALGIGHLEATFGESGFKLQADGETIATDPEAIAVAGPIVHKLGGDSHEWVGDSYYEEIVHNRDFLATRGQGKDFSELHRLIHVTLGKEAKAALLELYPDRIKPWEQGAEYVRMVAQYRVTGYITESNFRSTEKIEPFLAGKQSDLLERHLALMAKLTEGEQPKGEQPKGEQPSATTTRKEQTSDQGELPRIPPRADVRTHEAEIRKETGGQTGGGGGAVERPSPPAREPSARQVAGPSALDAATQQELRDTFKDLFASEPKLRPGEKQGDLLAGGSEDLILRGEEGTDYGAIQKKAEEAAKAKAAAEKEMEGLQGSLFASKPLVQRDVPPEKLGQFVLLAQKLIAQGIDTPEKLVAEMKNLDERARPFTQFLWDAIGMVNSSLRGTHDWGALYEPKKPERRRDITRAKAPDGGFSEHPFIASLIDNHGGLLSRTAAIAKRGKEWFEANKSLWDGAPKLADARHNKIYNSKTGLTPDEMAGALADEGMLRDGYPDELWRQIGLISDSSQRIQEQEREQNRLAREAEAKASRDEILGEEDPFGVPDAPEANQVSSFFNDEYGFETRVTRRDDGAYAVAIIDDSNEVLPSILIIPDKELAISKAKSLAGIDDRSGSTSLEPDRGNAGAGEPGGAGGLPAGPAAAPADGGLLGESSRGSPDAPAVGPLSNDVPSAPHGVPSDQLFREPAPPAERGAPGSPGLERGGELSERGVAPDTERTGFSGENLVGSGESQKLAGHGDVSSQDVEAVLRAAPALTPEQADDVVFVEARLLGQGKPGVLLTNGTGTGKTFSGLGAIKRMLDSGAEHILVVAPSDKIGSDWVHTAQHFFGIKDVGQLKSTVDNGKGQRLAVTTYANFGQNDTLVQRPWDMIVTDESHYLEQSEEGGGTLALDALRALTWHPQGIVRRVHMLEPEATQRLRALTQLERRLSRQDEQLSAEQRAERDRLEPQVAATDKAVRSEQETKTPSARPKVVMLSATPFAYRKNVAYANGYLFDYPIVTQEGYNAPSPFGQFMMENFGYRMRTGRLTEPENATASGILERRFAERLMREKAMRGRALVVPFDYSRQFILTESQLGKKIDDIITKMMSTDRLRTLSPHIGVSDYLQRRFILEALKAREAVPRIMKHLALSRRVVVFHDYKLGGALNPLRPNFGPGASTVITIEGKKETVYLADAFAELKRNFPDWDEISAQLNGLQSPIDFFTKAFAGTGKLGIFNGNVPKNHRRQLVKDFNGGKIQVLLAQRASAKEGISLHDFDGTAQRAFVDLGIPGRPTDAIQSEGRIYRHGVKSNAIDEYLVTGTNFERWTFAQTIAQRASTAENLAMGEGARSLLQSFSTGFNEAESVEPHAGQGTGGKEADAVRERGNPYQNAVALYYTNAKKTARTKSREGIDYFPTPEPLGFKMVEWSDVQPGEKMLEPSAGHGAIARFMPDSTTRHAVEPSNELAGRLALNAPDTEIHNIRFEDYNIVNKFDTIVMNSPWGVAGKTAMEHLIKAAGHLRDGGRLVALMPRGQMDRRFDEWMASDDAAMFHVRSEILLPPVTFQRAGTSISGRIVVIDRLDESARTPENRELGARALSQVSAIDLSDISDIKELFSRLEHLSVPARPVKPQKAPSGASEEEETAPPAKGPGYAPNLEAERKPLSPEHTLPGVSGARLPSPTRDSDFTPADFIHTRENRPVYVAKTARYMSKIEFTVARERAKQFGGYYSSFKGAGAIPGFHFKTVQSRDQFIGGTNTKDYQAMLDEPLAAANPLKAIYKDDVERLAKEIGSTVKESLVMLRKLVSPTTGVAMSAHDAVMKMTGDRNQKAYETDRVLEGYRKMFDKMARPEQIGFIDRMKRGQPQPTPELQQVADTMRVIDTESWEAAQKAYMALGFKDVPLAWLDNHYRVLWKVIPGGGPAGTWIGRARRGLRGSMGQHKQHTLEDMSEGLGLGGVPYSYNPVVMFKLAQADLWKLTTTLGVWKWAKDTGFVQFVRGPFPKAPDGMVQLDDSIANVYFPASSGEGLVAAGKYFVEEGFGRLLNNYLSRDHIRATKLGRGLLWIKNFTTSLELSLSLFHGMFETLEAIGSSVGLGLTKLINRGLLKGDLGAAAEGIRDMTVGAAAAPVTGFFLGREIRKSAADPQAYFKTAAGQKMLRNYPRAREMIDDLFAGGWKPTELEQDWKNQSIRTFIDAISDIKAGSSDNYIGAGLRAFPAANEFLMKPLFDYFIPNLKIAQFFKEYGEAIDSNERKLKGGVLTRSALARQVWRFVEDRFGELNYDTLFWNNNFKTAMQLMFRSVTWKLGSIEAFAGAFSGQAREFRDAFKERRAPELHRNTAWLFGMFLLTATLGAIISKVLARKDPQNLTDYVFPQIDPTDNKIRVSIPTYFKDLVHLIHSPLTYVTSSMSGWIGRVADLLRNKDYYGVQIRDTDDSVTKQALAVGKYAGETLLPFSIRGYKNLSAQDVGTLRKLLSGLGVNPAPRYIGQSKAEQASEEYWKSQRAEGGLRPSQFEAKAEKRLMVKKIQHGEDPGIGKALAAGTIKPRDVKALYQRAGTSALSSQVLHMPLEEAERIYRQATLKERSELAGVMAKKRRNRALQGRKAFSGF